MFKKMLSLLLALMMLCSFGAYAEEADCTGEWVLQGAEAGGAPVDLSVINLTMSMLLRPDGTCTLTTMGVANEGTWTAIEGGVQVTDFKGAVNDYLLVEGRLESEKSGSKLVFVRPATAADFVGKWVMTGMISQGVELSASTMALFGLSMTLTLNEDGTYALDTAGEVETGPWRVTATGVVIGEDDDEVAFTLEGDMLVFSKDDAVMMMTREGAAPAVAEAVSTAPLQQVPAESFAGSWELTTARIFGMEVTAADMGVSMSFDLADGAGIYRETNTVGASLEVAITYTVTEEPDQPTAMTLYYQDEVMPEPHIILVLNLLPDGRLVYTLNAEGVEVSYYFSAVTEAAAAE